MSLAIEVSDVTAVLMKEGRHTVTEKSFEIDKFDFVRLDDVRLSSGSVARVSSTGARWQEPNGIWVACQLPNVLAVRMSE